MIRTLVGGLVLLGGVACGKSASSSTPTDAPAMGPSVDTGGEGGEVGLSDSEADGSAGATFRLRDVRLLDGGVLDVLVVNGKWEAIASAPELDPITPDDAVLLDMSGRTLVPGIVDSHVHLSYYPVAELLPQTGVFAVVDFAAPIESLATPPVGLEFLGAGPMITSLQGYPTQSWGRNGYGLETDTPEAAEAAVAQLVEAGAAFIKIPVDGTDSLTDEQISALVTAAHERERRVAAHALSAEGAARAAELGCDLLAHTPTQPLPDSVVEAWAGGAVVSTLAAFGASEAALENLGRLRDAGTLVLYGTDLGNSRTAGISISELQAMSAAGLSDDEIITAATSAAAEYWGMEVGSLRIGTAARFLLVEGELGGDWLTMSSPAGVFDGTAWLVE